MGSVVEFGEQLMDSLGWALAVWCLFKVWEICDER
jgi:hypothetical protein